MRLSALVKTALCFDRHAYSLHHEVAALVAGCKGSPQADVQCSASFPFQGFWLCFSATLHSAALTLLELVAMLDYFG